MFRFINSGLKQSVTTLHNSIYNSPNLSKKINDDENEQKSTISRTKWEEINLMNPNLIQYRNNGLATVAQFDLFNTRNTILALLFDAKRDNQIIYTTSAIYFDFINKNICHNRQLTDHSSHSTDRREISVENEAMRGDESLIESINDDNSYNKRAIDECMRNLNKLGHTLNAKGCEVFKSNQSTALKYWNCAALFNYPPSQFNLGVYYESNSNLVTAEKWYRLAVKHGNHPTAAYNLALLLNNKYDVSLKDEIKRLFTTSANQGSKEAQKCIEIIDGLKNY